MASSFINPGAQILPRPQGWWESLARGMNPPLLQGGQLPTLENVWGIFKRGMDTDPVSQLAGGATISTKNAEKAWGLLLSSPKAFKKFEKIQNAVGEWKDVGDKLNIEDVLEGIASYDGKVPLENHIDTVAKNLARDIQRRESVLTSLDAPITGKGDEGPIGGIDISSAAPTAEASMQSAETGAELAGQATAKGLTANMIDPRMAMANVFAESPRLQGGAAKLKDIPARQFGHEYNVGKRPAEILKVISPAESRATMAREIGYSPQRIRELAGQLPEYMDAFETGNAQAPSLLSLRKKFFALHPDIRPKALEASGLQGTAQRGLEMFIGGQKPANVKGIDKQGLLEAFMNMFKELGK